MTNRKFTVVENAGYEGERDVTSFDTLGQALAWLNGQYSDAEKNPFDPDSLHVDIRQDWTDDEGEHSEYCY